MKKIFLAILFAGLILIPMAIQAAGLVPCGGSPRCCVTAEEIADPAKFLCAVPIGAPPTNCEYHCTFCHLFVMFSDVINFVLFQFIPPVAVLMLVWGGIKFYLAAENPAQAADAKKLITSIIIGMIIAYSAWLIINLFFAFMDINTVDFGFTGPGNWFKVNCPVP